MRKEWIVPGEEAGQKLIAFLSARLGDHYSARHLKKMLESNYCRLNHKVERFASTTVAKGDHITLDLVEKAPSSKLVMDRFAILYEDDHFLIYNKPSGINSDQNGILKILPSQLHLVHRLDRETSGALLLAKNSTILEQMIEKFRHQEVRKCYIAIVDGNIEKKQGTIQNFLAKKHVYEGQTIWGSASEGLQAHTDWEKIQEGDNATLVYCFPHTGRTHQLRVHLAEMGHPILGDFQYCKKFKCQYQPGRVLLHALQISFEHPITHKLIDVTAPLPADFVTAQKQLFKDSRGIR